MFDEFTRATKPPKRMQSIRSCPPLVACYAHRFRAAALAASQLGVPRAVATACVAKRTRPGP